MIQRLRKSSRPLICASAWILALAFSPIAAQAASIKLSWTAPGDDGNVGTAAKYDLRYSTSPITGANWATATIVTGLPAPKAAGTAESFTVTGLAPNTTYYFAIKTADEVNNWSAMSNVVSAVTADEIPPAAIADLTAQIAP